MSSLQCSGIARKLNLRPIGDKCWSIAPALPACRPGARPACLRASVLRAASSVLPRSWSVAAQIALKRAAGVLLADVYHAAESCSRMVCMPVLSSHRSAATPTCSSRCKPQRWNKLCTTTSQSLQEERKSTGRRMPNYAAEARRPWVRRIVLRSSAAGCSCRVAARRPRRTRRKQADETVLQRATGAYYVPGLAGRTMALQRDVPGLPVSQ